MIEKTRRETAESGHFFIAIGIFSAGVKHELDPLKYSELFP